MQKEIVENNERSLWLDVLRVLSSLAVVVIHVSARLWIAGQALCWEISNIFDGMVRWAVPIFVMISGALFLDKEISVKKVWCKYIVRLVAAFVFWSIVYAVVMHGEEGISAVIKAAINGHYHMWYIKMILGIYMITPILRCVVKFENIVKYFLVLSLSFSFILPYVADVIAFLPKPISFFADILESMLNSVSIQLTAGYVSYFLAGYYLSRADISIKLKKCIYGLGICGFGTTIIGTTLLYHSLQEKSEFFYGYLTLNVMLQSICVFVFARSKLSVVKVSSKVKSILTKMSRCSFGVYLVHVLVLEIVFAMLKVDTSSVYIAIFIPLIAMLVWGISMLIAIFMHKIPIVKKYLV